MYRTKNKPKEKIYEKPLCQLSELKYQRKIPKNSRVLIRDKSQEKNKINNSSKDFETIMENMYSEIEQNKLESEDNEDNDENINNDCLSPKKLVFSPENNNNQLIDRFTQISGIKPNNNEINVEQSSDNEIPNEEYIYSYDPKNGMKIDYENSGKKNLRHYFENYSIEYPLMFQNEINFSIDGTFNNKEKTKYDLKCNELNKKEEELINLMNKYNLLIKEMNDLKNKATITSDRTRDEDKTIEHLENIAIINKENKENKEKNKKKIKMKKVKKNKRMKSLNLDLRKSSNSEEPKTRDNSQNGFGTSTTLSELSKIKKYTPNIMIISKENELNLTASFSSLVKPESTAKKPKKKVKKLVKKNNKEKSCEKKIEKNNETIGENTNETKTENTNEKSIDKTKNNSIVNTNWNLLNKVDNNQSFDYIGKVDITISNNTPISPSNENDQKKVMKKKKKKLVVKKKDRDHTKEKEKNRKDRTTSKNHSIRKKIKKINLPTIDIKNETLSYSIQKKYIRFTKQTKSIDCKYIKNNNNNINNIKSVLNNKDLARCHSESLSINKKPKNKKKVIEKNIKINIINANNYQTLKEEEKSSNSLSSKNSQKLKPRVKIPKNIVKQNESNENYSENKDFSYFSSEIKENSDCISDDDKNLLKKKKIGDYNESNVKENSGEKKKKKYPLKIKIVKLGNKKNKSDTYFDCLFQKFVNKILVKRVFKKWLKFAKK